MSVLVKKPFLTGLVVFLLTVFWGSLGFTALYRRLPAALEWTLCLLSPFAFTAGMAQVRVHETISLFHSLCVLIAQSCPAPLSVEFSRPEYWSGEPFPSPGDLPNPGIKVRSPAMQVDSLQSEPPGKGLSTSYDVVTRITFFERRSVSYRTGQSRNKNVL